MNTIYKTFRVTAVNVPETDFSIVSNLISKRIEERSAARLADNAQLNIYLKYNKDIEEESYIISVSKNSIEVMASSINGLLYGSGKTIHNIIYNDNGIDIRRIKSISSKPDSKFRGIYLANHFFNWYHVASENEIRLYLEDLALWGYNTLILVFPIINLNGWNDPETNKAFERINMFVTLAHRLGMKSGIGIVPNQDFKNPKKQFLSTPNEDELGRRGNNGNNLCPAKDGCIDYLKTIYRETAIRMKSFGMDYIVSWPYDEGGCGCKECSPWGGNGFIRLSKLMIQIFREEMPNIKLIMSTWAFDTPYCNEWEKFANSLKSDSSYVDYILSDAHTDYPKYPLTHSMPNNIPLINFPEISMWGLFPWGGFGANPFPHRLQNLWNQVKDKVAGGYPYSEGIYDDINKAVYAGFYWQKNSSYLDSLKEYINYEYGVSEDLCIELIKKIEYNHIIFATTEEIDKTEYDRASDLATEIDCIMDAKRKKAWRWRILFIRAKLDKIRYDSYLNNKISGNSNEIWCKAVQNNSDAKAYMTELIELYHSFKVDDGTYVEHSWIRPPLH